MNRERVNLLINALKSGKYKQVKGSYRKDNCFCAIGVAAEVAMKNGCDGLHWQRGEFLYRTIEPGHEVSGVDETINWYGLRPYWLSRLIALNDSGSSFSEIADILLKEMMCTENV